MPALIYTTGPEPADIIPAPWPRPSPAKRAANCTSPIPPGQRPAPVIAPPSPAAMKLARRFRRLILAWASSYWFWQSKPDGTGPYLQNTTAKPLPIQMSGTRSDGRKFATAQAATITVERVYQHLFGGQNLFITNDPTMDVWNIAADIDNDAHGIAARKFNAEIGNRGHISPSRSTGQHVHFVVTVAGIDPTDAIYRLQAVADALRASNPQLEAFKGLPVIARNEAGEILTAKQTIAVAKNLYWTSTDDTTLDDALDVTIHQHSSLLNPCVNRAGQTYDQAIAAIDAYLTFRQMCKPITLAELEQLAGITSTPRPTTPAPPKPPARCDADHAPRSNRIVEMLASDSKPKARAGAVFAALQQLGDVEEEAIIERAHVIYNSTDVATDAELDRKRWNNLKATTRWAMRSFDETLRGHCPLDALGRQTGGPAWFTEADIARVERRLRNQIPDHELKYTTHRAIAIALLTYRKNEWLAQNGGGTMDIRQFREHRQWQIRMGWTEERGTGGFEQPMAAIKGMLRYFGLRSCGAAVKECVDKLVDLGAVLCTDKSYRAAPDHDGYSRKWQVSDRGQGLCSPDAAGSTINMDSQWYGVPTTINNASNPQPNSTSLAQYAANLGYFGGPIQRTSITSAENEQFTLN